MGRIDWLHSAALPTEAGAKARGVIVWRNASSAGFAGLRASTTHDIRSRAGDPNLTIGMGDNYTLEDVITVEHYVMALKKCMKNVGYKHSVQLYTHYGLHKIATAVGTIRNGEIPATPAHHEVVLRERGHVRRIVPVTIDDRVTQKVLCDYALTPLLERTLIYDNGASVRGKGTGFSRKRLVEFLEKAKRWWGPDNVNVLVFDFKSFFDSVRHSECYKILDRAFADKRLRDLTMAIVESYQAERIARVTDPEKREAQAEALRRHELCGICLGSQISQIMALAVPGPIDHLIKDKLGFKLYLRHMDDGIIVLNDRGRLEEARERIEEEAERLGLELNAKKTQIRTLREGFTFLKVRYRADGGKTVRTIAKSSVVRQRRKLKKFGRKIRAGAMSIEDAEASVRSWEAHTRGTRSFRRVRAMRAELERLREGHG